MLPGLGRVFESDQRGCESGDLAGDQTVEVRACVLCRVVEQEEEIEDGTDGSYLGRQYFHCLAGRGVFVPARHCQKDSRFDAAASRTPARSDCDSKTEMGKSLLRLFPFVPPLGVA